MMQIKITEDAPRLDRVLGDYLKQDVSRSQLTRWFKEGRIKGSDGEPVKAGLSVRVGDTFNIDIPDARPTSLVPESIPLNIVFEDTSIIVINKPQGMVVHPGAGNWTGTLANALAGYTENLSRPEDAPFRPGIVHRIDKDTSGLLVVARTDEAHRFLSDQLKRHEIQRHYTALVYGQLKEEKGVIDGPLARDPKNRKRMAVVRGGRPAVTHYHVVKRLKHSSLLALTLETGRTHQIRAHLHAIEHPVLADPVYAPGRPAFGMSGQALHAHELILTHPETREKMTFRAPLPAIWEELLTTLGSEKADTQAWIEGRNISWPDTPAQLSELDEVAEWDGDLEDE